MSMKVGWIAAGLFVLAIGGFILKQMVLQSPTRPSAATRRTGFMDRIEVAASITDVIGALPTGGGNAGDDYHQAVTTYLAAKQAIEDAIIDLGKGSDTGHEDALAALNGMYGHISSGAKKKEMKYLLVHAPKELRVGWKLPEIETLGEVGGCMDLLAAYNLKNNRPRQAEAIYKDLMIVGWHMTGARSYYHVVTAGFGTQMTAAEGLATVYRAMGGSFKQRVQALREYHSAVREADGIYGDKLNVLWKTKPHPGDVFNIAENDKDRAWRVQAVLAMGMLRYTADGRGDKKYNTRLLEKFARDKDPLPAAAAKAASELTEPEFNLLGTP